MLPTKTAVFWNTRQCSLVETYKNFRGNCCHPFLHTKDDGSVFSLKQLTFKASISNNFMQQGPSLEANTSIAGQQIPSILWNVKFITESVRANHVSLPCGRRIQSTPFSPSSKIDLNIQYPHIYAYVFQQVSFLPVFQPVPHTRFCICLEPVELTKSNEFPDQLLLILNGFNGYLWKI